MPAFPRHRREFFRFERVALFTDGHLRATLAAHIASGLSPKGGPRKRIQEDPACYSVSSRAERSPGRSSHYRFGNASQSRAHLLRRASGASGTSAASEASGASGARAFFTIAGASGITQVTSTYSSAEFRAMF